MDNGGVREGPNLAGDLENWMGRLPEELKKIAIIYLAIPGSHDSGTYPITSKSQLAPDAEKFLQNLRWLGPILTHFVSKWSKTQDFSAVEQLKSGVRFFDLRVATKPNHDLYIVHALYAEPVQKILMDINSYLNEHSSEVVILDCQHFYAMKPEDHNKLIRTLLDIFQNKIVPISGNYYMQHLSMEYLRENRYQILIIYRTNICKHPFFPSGCYPTPWPDTTNSRELIDILTNNLQQRNNSFGYVSQFILTPTGATIAKHLFGNLKKFSAEPLYKNKLDWVRDQRPGQGGVNVIIGDFIDILNLDFCRAVINLNCKLVKNPESWSKMLPPVTA